MWVYGFALAGALALIDRYDVGDVWGLILVSMVVGFMVEGVVTPVTYTGGPFVPFFPVWFSAWHGFMSIMLLLLAFRRWMLADARSTLLISSAGLGAFWGLWSLTLALPENAEDPELIEMEGGPLHVLNDIEFAGYALWVTAAVALAHYLLGRGAWMTTFRPGRISSIIWLAITAILIGVWTVAIPWAAPMFAVYVGGVVYVLRRRHTRAQAAGLATTSVLAELAGPVRAVSLLPLIAMPIAAAAVYSAGRIVDPSDLALRVLMYGTIVIQALAATIATVMAIVKAWRTPDAARPPAPTPTHQPIG
jgi:hypothetical protein